MAIFIYKLNKTFLRTSINILLLLFGLLLFIPNIFSQTNNGSNIKGKVASSENKPAAYVTIELKIAGKKTVADKNGFFILEQLPKLNDTLIITGIGFITYKLFVHVDAAQILDIGTVQLDYAIAQLQEVEIIGRIAQSYKSDYSFAGTKTQTAVKDIPQSVSTVTKELIKDKMGIYLPDALENVAGVNRYSGYDEYTIRGFRAENPHLINGLRTYNTSLTSPMLVNIERIEIMKGPTSVLYGNADPGGNINLVTKKPLQQKGYSLDLYKGSWNNVFVQGDITGPLNKSKNILGRFNAGYENTKSFRNQFFAKSFELAPSFSYVPNEKIQLNLDISLTHTKSVADRGQPGFEDDNTLTSTPISLMVTQPGDYLNETTLASILSFSYKINKQISFSSAYLNYLTWQGLSDHHIEDFITDDSVYLNYTNRQFNTVTHNLTNYFTFQFNTGKLQHQLLAGYDFIESRVSTTQWHGELADVFGDGSGIAGTFSLRNPQYFERPVNSYEHEDEDNEEGEDDDADEYTTNGLYLQEQLSINKWQLLAGLRGEFYKAEGDNSIAEKILLPRIGIVYAAAKNVNLYATYNKGFDPFESAGITQVFDEPYKPLYSEMLEAGIKTGIFKNKLFATLAIYQVTIKNVAVNANDPENPDLFTQRGEERARGLEAEANGNILPNLSLSLSYAYNVAKITKSDKPGEAGTIKENAPRNSSSSFIKYAIQKGKLKGLCFTAGHQQAGKRNTLDESLVLPSYFITNAGIVYTHSHISIALNINNITNKIYWTAAYNNISKWPGQPRNYMIRLGYNF